VQLYVAIVKAAAWIGLPISKLSNKPISALCWTIKSASFARISAAHRRQFQTSSHR